ncbi:MAG: UDP-N-acetylmuramoyl-L-alanine--D-glutamate ligase [Candidatus Saelkia tenebricola]|nr:UDP-N-acetylmuramoyl-L-alanine--D-glutamate ligase [Candidatus Saelkia tenebricola]
MREEFFCIIGLGKSGFSAAELLVKKGIKVKVTDLKNPPSLRKKASSLKKIGVEVELGNHRKDFYKGASLYVVSPGVDKNNPVVEYAKKENLPLISEIELAWMYCPSRIIAITGTNGKTSVSTYTYQILKKSGFSVYLAGNIGLPFSQIVSSLKFKDLIILEISSFQLENIVYFHPYIAVLLNIAPDHLDRYRKIEEYVDIKFNVFRNQIQDDIAILNLSQNIVKKRVESISSNILDVNDLRNLNMDLNEKFVYSIGRVMGLEEEYLIFEIQKLKKLKHRMENLGAIQGVEFINDSKATNPHSTKWALNSISKEVVLIAGGRDKKTDFKLLQDEFSEKVKAMVLIGEAKEKILISLGGFVEVVKLANDLEEAVKIAFDIADPRDTVLLSPMCASFDMFKDYEDRGNKFKKIVQGLKKCSS